MSDNFDRLMDVENVYEFVDILMEFIKDSKREIFLEDGEVTSLPLLRWLQSEVE